MTDFKSRVFVHLLMEHDVLLTVGEYERMTLDELMALDPCEVINGV